MGYNTGGTYFENHRSSGFDTVANDVSCVVELTRSKRQAGGMMPNTDSMEIDIDEILMKTTAACRSRYINDTRGIDLNSLQVLPPCPCTLDEAENDPGFEMDTQFRNTENTTCYIQRFPEHDYHHVVHTSQFIYGQHCCYNTNDR